MSSSRNGPLASSRDWDRDSAAHLLRRAGFGPTPEDIDRCAGLGRQGAVAAVIDFDRTEVRFAPPTVLPYQPSPLMGVDDPTPEQRDAWQRARRRTESVESANLADWWARRLVTTPRPLEEKLTLMWHGHFTSGMREVQSAWMMYNQNQMFRRFALDDLRTLLVRVSTDPAMLRYLNNDENVARQPNENYARELLELFTLGEGHYSERDVKDVARAFTGWSVDRYTGSFEFNPRNHDDGAKMVFGRIGPLQGTHVIDLILNHSAAAKHLAGKVWKFFAGAEPGSDLLEALAGELRRQRFQFRPFLQAMFLSDAFYDPSLRMQMFKSPAELVVGACRLLEMRPVNAELLVRAMKRMGQELLQPPNVKGWDGGRRWINTATLFERYNFAAGLLYGAEAPRERQSLDDRELRMMADVLPRKYQVADRDPNDAQPPFDPGPIVRRHRLTTPESVVDHFVKRLWQCDADPPVRALLLDHLRRLLGDTDPSSPGAADAIRGLLHLLISSPEYQLQ